MSGIVGEISLEMTFDAGHRIVGHKGKCARLHGHTYRVKIEARGEVVPPGFVVDFGDIKEVINRWDHRMLLWEQDEIVVGDLYSIGQGILVLPFNPTAENMARSIGMTLIDEFGLDAIAVELWETANASARFMV